jgi:protein required for attachment to host cells
MPEGEAVVNDLVVWILSSNDEEARIYIRRKRTDWRELAEKKIRASGAERWELVSIGPVLQRPASGPGRKETATIRSFVKTIAAYINRARAEHLFHRLVVIAPTQLLAALRRHFTKTVRLSVIAEQTQDFPLRGGTKEAKRSKIKR